jgi:hypothetical protein
MIIDQKGQSVVEVLVAISIIVLALIGFLTQSTSNFLTVAESYDRMVGANLAREVMESVRAHRDSNWLKACPDPATDCTFWDDGLYNVDDYTAASSFDPATGEFLLDFAPDNIDDCILDNSCLIYQQLDGVYNHVPVVDQDTKFYRLVTLSPICADTIDCGGDGICDDGQVCLSDKIGIKVKVHVRWFIRDDARNVEVEDYLYNWR